MENMKVCRHHLVWRRLTVVETFHSEPEMSTGCQYSSSWGLWKSAPNFMAIHPVDIEIFRSGPKWRTNKPTNWLTNGLTNKLILIPSLKKHEFIVPSENGNPCQITWHEHLIYSLSKSAYITCYLHTTDTRRDATNTRESCRSQQERHPFTAALSLEHMLTLLSTAAAVTEQLVSRMATKGKKEKQSASKCHTPTARLY